MPQKLRVGHTENETTKDDDQENNESNVVILTKFRSNSRKEIKVEYMLTQIVIEDNDKDVFSLLVPPYVMMCRVV